MAMRLFLQVHINFCAHLHTHLIPTHVPLQLQLKEQVKSWANFNHNKFCRVIKKKKIYEKLSGFFFFISTSFQEETGQPGEPPTTALMVLILSLAAEQWAQVSLDFWNYPSSRRQHSTACERGKVFHCTNLEFTLRSTSKLLLSSPYYDP